VRCLFSTVRLASIIGVIMRVLFPCVLMICCVTLTFPQSGKPRPDFSDYPVQHIYTGKHAPPILSKEQRWFRTRIREGAEADIQFAGHYTVPAWGCGSSCIAFVIVDSISGRVYDGSAISALPDDWVEEYKPPSTAPVEFHPTSRLLKVNGCPSEHDCGLYDYVIVGGKGLKLIRKELLPQKYQPE